VVLHAALNETAELVLHFGELAGREAARYASTQRFGARRGESGTLGRAKELKDVGLGSHARAGAVRLGHLLGAGTEP
jgi:hypothetical protein